MNIELLNTADLLYWPIGRDTSEPFYKIGTGSYKREVKVDPFPCYSHDFDRVSMFATGLCENVFPLKDAEIAFYILGHETLDRCNGTTYQDSVYRENDKDTNEKVTSAVTGETFDVYKQALFVILSGKRIPLHPAMTRYLVTHEYGHMAFYYASRKLGYRDSEQDMLEDKYMELRGVKKESYTQKYTGAKWHINPGEIIANDFRILYTKQEKEFWPHPVPYPEDTPIVNWWKQAEEACSISYLRN